MKQKYKELYQKEKNKNQNLLKEIEYYKETLSYMKNNDLIEEYFDKYIRRTEFCDKLFRIIKVKVNSEYDFEYIEEIDEEE